MAFYAAENADGSAHLGQIDEFVLHHQRLLLLSPNYSHALVLEPVDGKDEFTLLKVGKIGASILATPSVPPPKLLCLLPVSAEELAFARNGIISRPDEFPLLKDSKLLWRESENDPENYWDSSLKEALEDLLSGDFLSYYETETKMWARWQELERQCMPTFLDPAKMESIADYIRSLKDSSDWDKFRRNPRIASRVIQFGITNLFSLFILDPFKRCVTARDITDKGDRSNEDVGQNEDPGHALDRLSHWEMCTFDLLRHMQTYIHRKSLRFARFMKVLPGQNLLMIAQKTADYHSSVAQVVCRGDPSWDGWYTWFTAKKIARQQLARKSLQGEDPKSELRNGEYWDWDHMKTTMEARIAVWTEVREFRRRFEHELGDYNFDLLAHKLVTRRLMKEVGYDLGDDAVRRRSVTIR